MTKRLRALLAGLTIAGSLVGCSSVPAMLRADGVSARQVSVEQASELPRVVAATQRVGTTVLKLAPRDTNVVVSPSGLVLALGMLTEGARGDTLNELERSLGATGEGRRDALAALRESLLVNDGDPATATADKLPDRPIIHSASQIVTKDEYPVDPAYLAALADGFDAGVQRADLSSAAGMDVLSAWIRQHTGGLIKQTAITPDPRLRLVLQDAILLAARWQTPFSAHATAPRDFTLADGSQIQPRTMANLASFAVAEVGGWQAVRLPYVEALHTDLLLPPTGVDPADVTSELLAKVSAALDQAQPERVELTVPALDLKPDPLDLLPMLSAIGAPVSCSDSPDLSGIGPEQVCVGQAMQQSVLKVDEEGTVAAAVTGIGIRAESAAPQRVREIHFDRAFLQTITHDATGWPLFLAAVRDPQR